MTQQQQTDLKIWQEDQSQSLPASLENALLEDCLDNYIDGSYTVQWFNDRCFVKLEKILSFLSRTPDGEAVMPFLDKILVGYESGYNDVHYLDHLLYRKFTEALRVGKPFGEALSIINLIYCQNIKNP
jgi:hypothetical protein